jgi:peptidoglycan-N-acetylglucosamine deacetylase
MCSSAGQVAITFDDGPGQPTPQVLTALKARGVKATFHVVTEFFDLSPVITNIDLAAKDEHVIGLRFPTKKDPTTMSDAEITEILISDSKKVYDVIKKYPKFLRYNIHK